MFPSGSTSVLLLAAILAPGLSACPATTANPPAKPAPKKGPGPLPLDELHRQALVIDTHVDTPSLMFHQPYDIGKINDEGHVDLPRMRIGGLDGAFFAIWINPDRNPGEKAWTEARRMLMKVRTELNRLKDQAELVVTARRLRQMAHTRKRAILLGVEGGHMLGGGSEQVQLDRLRELYVLGVRYLTITWANDNDLGGSSWDGSRHKGLTKLGKRIIEEMNLMGMMVDVSHVSDQTFKDILKVTTKPVIASHSTVRALCDLVRNIPDNLLRAVRRNGGAVCVNFYAGFLDKKYRNEKRRLDDEYRAEYKYIRAEYHKKTPWFKMIDLWRFRAHVYREIRPLVTVDRLIDHLAHIIRVAGEDHVCLGSDYDGMSAPPFLMDDVASLPLLTRALRRRGFPDRVIRKILGLNVLRVFAAQSE